MDFGGSPGSDCSKSYSGTNPADATRIMDVSRPQSHAENLPRPAKLKPSSPFPNEAFRLMWRPLFGAPRCAALPGPCLPIN